MGIGASAGGLDAFKRLFSTMPGDCGMAFVLIQHLDPTRKSLTTELVATYTPMRVGLQEVKAAGGMTMVQDPQTAQHDGMPRSAIASGCADYVAPVADMTFTPR